MKTAIVRMKIGDAEKLALEVAELANRETSLTAQAERILNELTEVSAAKTAKLQQLVGGANGANGTSPSASQESDKKERVYQMLAAQPARVFATSEVIESLGLNRSTTSVYLSELAMEARIRRIAKGQYQVLHGGRQQAAPEPTTSTEEDAMPKRIMLLLTSEPETIFNARSIGKRFGMEADSIRGALSRLSRNGKIAKVSHGEYKALPGRQEM